MPDQTKFDKALDRWSKFSMALMVPLFVSAVVGAAVWARGVDRDIIRLDTNQKTVMGSVREMATAVSVMSVNVSRLEGWKEAKAKEDEALIRALERIPGMSVRRDSR